MTGYLGRRRRRAGRAYSCVTRSPWCTQTIPAGSWYADVMEGPGVWRGRACMECAKHWAAKGGVIPL